MALLAHLTLVPDPDPGHSASFACCLRGLRQRWVGKQICLAGQVGCAEAAVSYWESGKRLPQDDFLARIHEVLSLAGAPAFELARLRLAWAQERSLRGDSRTTRPGR